MYKIFCIMMVGAYEISGLSGNSLVKFFFFGGGGFTGLVLFLACRLKPWEHE
jgi:hypothetical protein